MDGGNAGNAGAVPSKSHSRPVLVPYDTGTSHIHVGRSYGLSDKTAGQPFCAAEQLPEGRSAWMHFV